MPASQPEFSPEELKELLSGLLPDVRGYRLLRRIGHGGSSYVYLGVQESLDRQVAIKVMVPDALEDEVGRQRFEKEARTIAKLEHPNIVGIYEVGRTEQGLLFYVMPYLARGHLGERDLNGDERRIAEILRSLLLALDYAHARGIVHRDVKAENVLFDNADRPLLTDFGIATSRRDNARITRVGLAIGSGGYMAPEQARGERVDARADLYSLGVLAYELLAGELPFRNDDALGLALMHAQDPVPRLPAGLRHWQAFIDRAMAKSPAARFQTAAEMLDALARLPSGAGATAGGGFVRVLRGLDRRVLAAVAGVAGAVLLGALLWGGGATEGEAPAPALASTEAQASGSPTAAAADGVRAADATDATGADAPAALDAAPPDDARTPGEQALADAASQIARGRLTQPPGDNALASLREARRLLPDSPRPAELAERWLAAVGPHLVAAVSDARDAQAVALFERAGEVADLFGLRARAAWSGLAAALVEPLRSRLRTALDARDGAALASTRQLAGVLAVPTAELEPLWSRPLMAAQVGDAWPGPRGWLLLRLPDGARSGLAVQRTEVTRADYARFAQATGRPEARCRNRNAPISLKKRRWADPGFPQGDDHPVVCVSAQDADAYAVWRGGQDGRRYRLPTAAEWRAWSPPPAGLDACAAGRIDCGGEGTRAAGHGPAATTGLRGLWGNAREWLSDCGDDCRRRRVAGLGWRDAPGRGAPDAIGEADAGLGYDDIGFRLVAEVRREELAPR